MSVYRDKARGRYVFEFDARIDGQRVRARKILPKTWSRTQAETFGERERARLYNHVRNGHRAAHTIDDAVSKYLDYRCPELKSGRAAAAELAQVHWAFSGKPLTALDEVCREIARDGREDKPNRRPLAAATIRNRIRYLTAACRYAWKFHGMGETDPAARVSVPEVRNERHIYATRAEMLKLARACRNRTVRAIIRIAFYSGMRRGEILRAEPRAGLFVLETTKNGMPRRVPIHPRIRCCLSIYPITISVSTIVKHWMIAREATGLTHLHFHDIRHSAASEMINADIDLYTVGSVLGHRDPRSTQRYAHLATQTLATAVDRIGRRK